MSRTREAFFKPRSIMILAAAVVATVVLLPVVVFALAPPTVLTAVAGQAEPTIARLNWKASTSADAAHYVVSVATSADGPFKVVGSTEATGYDFKDGLGGVTYYFRVAAVNVLGELSPPEVTGPVKATWVSDPHAPATPTTNKCASCHVPHSAQASPLMRTEISTDTPGQEATCLTCHDGKIATAGNIADGTKDSFALASGHALDTTISAGGLTNNCASCHDPHRTANASPMIPQAKINGNQVSLAGKEWCLACHDDNNSWYPDPSTYPTASVPQRDGAGYPTLGTWLGKTAYNDAGNAHRLVPETTYTAGSGQQVRRGQGDCLYCHAAHRGTNAYDGLLGTYRPTTPSTLAADKEQGDYAAACFTCHGGVTPSGFATAPVDIKGFVTSGGTTSGHSIVTSGGLLPVGAPLPCYECHNPHGSKRGNDSMLSDVLGGSLTTTGSPSAVRQFCFTCHTTAGTAKGWDSAAATYTAVAVGDKVVGIPRIGGGELDGVLDLPSISGHGQDDATSCYQCHGSDYGQPNSNNVHNPNLGGYDTATHTAAPLAEFVMISGMSYGPVVCADCHNTLLSAEHEKVTSSSAGGGCATCHPTPKNTLTPSWDKSCAQGGCHTASSSAPMHGNIDTSHVPVAGQTCYAAGCHPASGTDSLAETHVLASAVLGGQTRTSCQVCHWNGIPASGECASCHADRVDGTHGAGTSHAFTAGSDAVTDGDAGCTNSGTGCHGIDATRLSFASYHLNNGCTAGVCHSSTSKPGYAGNGDCQSCHDASFAGAPARADLGTQHYNETTHTATGLSATVSAGGSASATCATCH
ncbi:MAG: cytochrome c3 family protein, partial [Actinomycetes bacterium]